LSSTQRDQGRPVLWHIPISHYNEKVRWTLDYKGVDCERKAPPPPAHMAVALWKTRGSHKTFPLFELNGRAVGDSTAIIAVLEERYPEPALYPEDPADCRRALELEEFFDEELGPHSRLLAFHHIRRDPEALAELTSEILPARLADNQTAKAIAAKGTSAFAEVRYHVSGEEAADLAAGKILEAFDRLETELGLSEGDYLVGDRFSVADLTAASLLEPVVAPPEGPNRPDAPVAYEQFREPLRERPGFKWVTEMFARHRGDATRP
jgi:glutathione S-transferase